MARERMLSRRASWTVVPVLTTVFLNAVGVGLLIPILPFLAERFGADAIGVGFLFTLFATCQFLTTPILGSLSDRYGRRPILLACLAGSAISYATMGLAPTLAVLCASRALAGAAAGSVSAAQSCIADLTPPEKRTAAFGTFGAVYTGGWLIGPASGGLLSMIDLRAPAFAACALTTLNLLIAAIFVRETLAPDDRRAANALSTLNPFAVLVDMVRAPMLRIPIITTFLLGCVFATFQANFPVLAGDRFALGPSGVAKFFFAISVIGVVAQAYLVKLLSDRFADGTILLAGILLLAFSYVAIGLVPTLPLLWLAVPVSVVGNALWRPSLMALMSKRVGADRQGVISGASQSAMSLGLVVGPLWAGAAYASLGMASPYITMAVLALATSGLLLTDLGTISSGKPHGSPS